MFKNTLKRLGAIVLALAMAMSVMMVSAFAEAESDGSTLTIKKAYKDANSVVIADTTKLPVEALELEHGTDWKSAKDYTNTDYATASNIPDITVTKADKDSEGNFIDTFSINIPDTYQGVGTFTYTMTEKTGDAAGVDYNSTEPITIIVQRTWKDDNRNENEIVTKAYVNNANGEKIDTITNTFKSGALEISKKFAGAFADESETFTVTVTFTAPQGKQVKNTISYTNGTDSTGAPKTSSIAPSDWNANGTVQATVTVGKDLNATFNNIPYDVTYTVVETVPAGYKDATYEWSDANKTINSEKDTVEITNTKEGTVVTGVIMNIAPYVLMVALAGGIAFFFLRRRNAE